MTDPLTTNLLNRINIMIQNKNIILRWIPSYTSIQRHEKANKAAKNSRNMNPINAKIPYTDLQPNTNKSIKDKWNCCHSNKLHSIQPNICEWHPGYWKKRSCGSSQTLYRTYTYHSQTLTEKQRTLNMYTMIDSHVP